MSICIDKLEENISSPCKNPLFAGKRRKGWLFNRADISSYTTSPTNDHIVEGIMLASGAKGYFIQADVKLPFNASVSAMNEGDYTNDFTHNVVCYIPNDGADWRENIVNKIANGEFVVVLENKWTGNNGDNQFQIFGLQQGLLAVSDVNEDAENGGWNFTLQENGTPMSGMYYWHTDEETSRNDLDALAGGGGGEDWTPKWFYVEDASGAANTLTIKKSNGALPDKVFEWSLDKQNWTEITVTDTTGVSLAVPANGRVYLRGDSGSLTHSNGNYQTKMNCAALYNIGGDITTLISRHGYQRNLPDYCFKTLFSDGSQGKLTDVSALLFTVRDIGTSALEQIFRDNKQLTNGGCILDFDSIKYGGLSGLFYGCTALITPPTLPAATLGSNCYNMMFYGCTALTEAPVLPAATLASSCYSQMFRGCINLARVEVYATTWVNQVNWLDGVAATGDFYNLGGATIPTGTDGIPSGWTEHTQLP